MPGAFLLTALALMGLTNTRPWDWLKGLGLGRQYDQQLAAYLAAHPEIIPVDHPLTLAEQTGSTIQTVTQQLSEDDKEAMAKMPSDIDLSSPMPALFSDATAILTIQTATSIAPSTATDNTASIVERDIQHAGPTAVQQPFADWDQSQVESLIVSAHPIVYHDPTPTSWPLPDPTVWLIPNYPSDQAQASSQVASAPTTPLPSSNLPATASSDTSSCLPDPFCGEVGHSECCKKLDTRSDPFVNWITPNLVQWRFPKWSRRGLSSQHPISGHVPNRGTIRYSRELLGPVGGHRVHDSPTAEHVRYWLNNPPAICLLTLAIFLMIFAWRLGQFAAYAGHRRHAPILPQYNEAELVWTTLGEEGEILIGIEEEHVYHAAEA